LQVHFTLRGPDLLVRTEGPNGVSEFIPTDKLRGDIPNILISQTYVMFHDASQALEIFPSRSGWDPSTPPSWRMLLNPDLGHPQLINVNAPADAVLCPDSHVVKGIHCVFAALEKSAKNLLCISAYTLPLRVILPRYKLNFYININGDLECKDLPRFSVSVTQAIGTLCGLVNKLVLESTDGHTRKVIIPAGTDQATTEVFQGNDSSLPHPRVIITPSSDIGCHIRAFVYDVDTLLGRLIGDGTLTSWYFLAYLHVLTSYWLCDPLTNRTGIQQALQMLRSANSFSFMKLTDEHINIFTSIVNITPDRGYYPDHLTSMETVVWHSILSPLSQIASYTLLVEAILDHGNKQDLFRSGKSKKSLRVNEKGAVALRKRAEFRYARFVVGDLHDLGEKPAGMLLYTYSSDDADFPFPFR
jgi:hypothetical protein